MPASRTDTVYRTAGVVVGVLLAIATALWEALLTPLYVTSGHTVIRLPVATVLAVITNLLLVWFMIRITDRPFLAIIPGVVWSLVIFIAGSVTSEGDLLILGNWVGVATTFIGSIAWAVGAYFVIIRRAAHARAEAPPSPVAIKGRPANTRPAKR